MSITLEQVILDAKLAANRINDESKLEAYLRNLHFKCYRLNKKLESKRMPQSDDTEALDRVARGAQNNTDIVRIINQENRENLYMREIQQENRELKACLEDYQRTMEHIMTKYREHTQRKVLSNKLDLPDVNFLQQKDEIIKQQNEKILEMAAVMQRAASMDEDQIHRETEGLIRLVRENEGLRELLQISRQFGSINYGSDGFKVEKSIQTSDLSDDDETQDRTVEEKKDADNEKTLKKSEKPEETSKELVAKESSE
ncbi:FGFR1 oncogene partner 2 homolog [Phlebotomus papatasi]|uniref:FGFR1 oncogene partner 2 homolog n=1 Tax=Phlebotomus papatasi TaxID=29031 RepID=UPI002483ACB4|nr:FGFR1 oncogene partner 2 homolog [Phlebotomus papatasi]